MYLPPLTQAGTASNRTGAGYQSLRNMGHKTGIDWSTPESCGMECNRTLEFRLYFAKVVSSVYMLLKHWLRFSLCLIYFLGWHIFLQINGQF